MKRTIVYMTALVTLLWSCTSKQEKMENRMNDFISSYEKTVIPLYKESALSSWDANVTGTDEAWARSEKASLAYISYFTDKEAFAELKELKESGMVKDSVLARQLDVIYNQFLAGQVDTSLLAGQVRMETEITKKFNSFRADVNGKMLSDNEVEEILRNSTNSVELKAAWEGHKMIGPAVADDIIRLVKHRNRIAQELGFSNYHQMSLKLSGQDPEEVTGIFDELDSLTRGSFAALKGEIDNYHSKRYGIPAESLMPWHYQNRYFQEAPEIYSVDFDSYYADKDPVQLASAYYASIGLPVDSILASSDLYEKPGKNQHAFSTDIDREGDVRTLDNIKPDSYWMNTIMHELGHGVYSYYNDRSLPFALRDAAHTFTTEAVANFFGRYATDPAWMQYMGIIDADQAGKIAGDAFNAFRLQQLVFSRWAQVMYRFEKAMYENPDQDLNQLWWDTVEKYQMMKKPEGRDMPDWATKIHVALYPCYYHNYLLGELLASQFAGYISSNLVTGDTGADMKALGEFFRTKVFMPGMRYEWNDMIERATGEKLTAKYYASQVVGEK
ncbi:MAG: M2 family metallopeptidase [Bacteroidales bacterium]|jgi:peptidyl-dipeptidase A|nr:M2 family metallopeptidase [Bacteroidales bacterium]